MLTDMAVELYASLTVLKPLDNSLYCRYSISPIVIIFTFQLLEVALALPLFVKHWIVILSPHSSNVDISVDYAYYHTNCNHTTGYACIH